MTKYLEVLIRKDYYVMKVQDPTQCERQTDLEELNKHQLFNRLIHSGYKIQTMINDLNPKEDIRYLFVNDTNVETKKNSIFDKVAPIPRLGGMLTSVTSNPLDDMTQISQDRKMVIQEESNKNK